MYLWFKSEFVVFNCLYLVIYAVFTMKEKATMLIILFATFLVVQIFSTCEDTGTHIANTERESTHAAYVNEGCTHS